MKYIVTIKLPRNPGHDPHNKLTGNCPATGEMCTDVTGEHHSMIVEADGEEHCRRVTRLAGFRHITRIEAV